MNRQETFVRINSRIRPEQFAFIQTTAKERKIGDGVLHREIIDEYIKKHK